MRYNPKHQFTILLRRHKIEYSTFKDHVVVNNTWIRFCYESNYLIFSTPLCPEFTFQTPWQDKLHTYLKMLRFNHMVEARLGNRIVQKVKFMTPVIRSKPHPQLARKIISTITAFLLPAEVLSLLDLAAFSF